MEKSITFRELVKLIHPDVATVENASEKMTIAVQYKTSPTYLYKKAIEWGVIITKTAEKVKKYKNVNYWVWKLFYGEIPCVGDFIFVKTKHCRVKVAKITPKRFYFYFNGKKTFCGRKNAVMTRKVEQTRKMWSNV